MSAHASSENAVYHLSNFSGGQEFDLTVVQGADVLAAAQAHLEESGLPGDLQHGFYISVYPREPAEHPVGALSAPVPGAKDDGSTEDDAILA